MIDIAISDPFDTKKRALVSESGEILIMDNRQPVFDGAQKTIVFRQFLTTTGLASGSNDMGIDGSSTNVDFYIEADDEKDRYIAHLNVIVAYGTTGQPNEWADGTALGNGSRLFYTNEEGEQDIHNAIKSNQDMFRLSTENIPTAWEVRHVNANNDFGYFTNINFLQFGMGYGIKLSRGTRQRLTMRIRDNAGTDADTFNCIAYGFERAK